MSKIKSLRGVQIAERFGVTPRHIRQLSMKYGYGTKVSERLRLYTEADVAKIERHLGKPGLSSPVYRGK